MIATEVYLDNAATSHPKPEGVLEAVRAALTDYNANPGRSGHRRALAGARKLLECREALAALLNAGESENIALCFNCTDALNLAIKGSVKRGDHVVASLIEHNSVLRVLTELKARGTIEFTLVAPAPDGFVSSASIGRELRRNTALVALTHASNVTGAIQPVAEVGNMLKRRGVRYLIDGAQALGHVPVDVKALGCQMYAFPGHKALLGPQGTGGLYIAPGLELNTLREGGTGSSSDSMRQPPERPERYESGTANLPGLAGLTEGVRCVSIAQNARLKRERRLTGALMEGLRGLGATVYSPAEEAARVGVVSFNIGDMTSSQVADALSESDIAVRGGLHCAPGAHEWLGTLRRGAVRASVGWATCDEDIETFMRAVRALV